MHPTIGYELAKTRIADFHRQAQRDALARAARRTRHGRPSQPMLLALRLRGAVTRRLLALLGAAPGEPLTASLAPEAKPRQ
jgi:hypothetical protein